MGLSKNVKTEEKWMIQSMSRVDLDSIQKIAKKWLCDSIFGGDMIFFKSDPFLPAEE